MVTRARRLLVVTAVTACNAIGCSFVFTRSPPEHPELVPVQHPIECTSSKAAPIVDVIITGFQVVRTSLAIAADDEQYEDFPITRGADIGIGAGLAALFAVSSGYGFANTNDCARMKRAHERRVREHPTYEPFSPPVPSPQASPPQQPPTHAPSVEPRGGIVPSPPWRPPSKDGLQVEPPWPASDVDGGTPPDEQKPPPESAPPPNEDAGPPKAAFPPT